jgi:hypothetical protein
MTTKLMIHVAARHQSLVAHVIEQCDCSQVDSTVQHVTYAIAKGLRKKNVSTMHIDTCMPIELEKLTGRHSWSCMSSLWPMSPTCADDKCCQPQQSYHNISFP